MCSVCKEFIMIRFHQVNNFLIKQLVAQSVLRLSHTKSSNNKLYPLNSKKLIRMKGNDAFSFLQGLITNDMRHFQEGAKSIYAMFLNNKGRVLYDSLIHKWETDDQFLLECDHKIQDMLLRHLKIYKLKRAIEIEDVSQHLKLWAYIAPENNTTNIETEPKSGVKIYKDPRLNELGFRIISTRNLEGLDLVKNINNKCIANNEDGYKELRYRLGVCEGAEDLPSGLCFPLEVNCDYLHGVSFHKGCYIGQELTARVHHTGVVRKRIMPLKFYEPPNECLAKDTMIYGDNVKSSLGKLKGMSKEYGIGLFRIKETLEAKVLSINTHTIEVVKPKWWPLEAPKEKVIKSE